MPKKRGRFIPCRGGGTATTYYTDVHEVDEDMTAISVQGGRWLYENGTGVTHRAMWDPSDSGGDPVVASRLIYLS